MELLKGKSANLSQFVLQVVIFCHIEILLGGGLVKVLQELSVFSVWVEVILREGVKRVQREEEILCCAYNSLQQSKTFHIFGTYILIVVK